MADKSIHEVVAEKETRGEHGHFAKKPPSLPAEASAKEGTMNPVSKFLSEHVNVRRSKILSEQGESKDDLLNIHIGNPLRKLVALLEDIKKQKAFSFTLKGSLGLVGVVLALSLFGIFGTDKLLCSKGIQSQIGIIKVLQIKEETKTSFFSQIPFLNSLFPINNSISVNRIVLVRKDDTAIRLENIKPEDVTKFSNLKVIITGNYDSCTESLKVNDSKSIEPY